MSARARTLATCAGLLIYGVVAAGELLTEQAGIDHNPFERPRELRAHAVGNEAPTLMAKGALELRGVLIAGSGSQANINGRIMALGEVLDGYRLVSVSTEEVQLRRDGEKIVLRLRRGREQ